MLGVLVEKRGELGMEFMDLLREWLELRELGMSDEDNRSIPQRGLDRERMAELEHEINKRARGEL